jgi:hypothetical protein
MRASTKLSLQKAFFAAIALSVFFSSAAPLVVKVLWWIAALYSFFKVLTISLTSRVCGHGSVFRSGPFVYPWVIDPCPKCGKKSFGSESGVKDSMPS